MCKQWIDAIKDLNNYIKYRFISKNNFISLVKNLINLNNSPVINLEFVIMSDKPFKPVKVKIYQQRYSSNKETYFIYFKDNRCSKCIIKIWKKYELSIAPEEIKQIKYLIKYYWKPNLRTYSAGLIDFKRSLEVREKFKKTCKDITEKNSNVVLIYCDIDNFKKVNLMYGLSTGDKIIREIGAILETLTINTSILLHNGGDEFVLLTQNTKNLESLLNRINYTFKLHDFKLHFKLEMTISISVYNCITNFDNLIEISYEKIKHKKKDKKLSNCFHN